MKAQSVHFGVDAKVSSMAAFLILCPLLQQTQQTCAEDDEVVHRRLPGRRCDCKFCHAVAFAVMACIQNTVVKMNAYRRVSLWSVYDSWHDSWHDSVA